MGVAERCDLKLASDLFSIGDIWFVVVVLFMIDDNMKLLSGATIPSMSLVEFSLNVSTRDVSRFAKVETREILTLASDQITVEHTGNEEFSVERLALHNNVVPTRSPAPRMARLYS